MYVWGWSILLANPSADWIKTIQPGTIVMKLCETTEGPAPRNLYWGICTKESIPGNTERGICTKQIEQDTSAWWNQYQGVCTKESITGYQVYLAHVTYIYIYVNYSLQGIIYHMRKNTSVYIHVHYMGPGQKVSQLLPWPASYPAQIIRT